MIFFFFCLSSDIPTQVFGDHLRQQVEDRLKFYETGEAPAKNIDIMRQAVTAVCICYWIEVACFE